VDRKDSHAAMLVICPTLAACESGKVWQVWLRLFLVAVRNLQGFVCG
jgi:hypothetical protein